MDHQYVVYSFLCFKPISAQRIQNSTLEPSRAFTQVSEASLNERARDTPNPPIQHAFQSSLRPAPPGPIPIDPALQALPAGPDLDLTHAGTIASAKGLKRADKVAGSRRNGKGKECADKPAASKKRAHTRASSVSDNERTAKRGRPHGSANYGRSELRKMFELVEDALPVGQRGWRELEAKYNDWADDTEHALRPPKALENKFKQYLRQKKPTGDASCPPEVKRAHQLEEQINEKVGTHELSDPEFQDASDSDSSDEVEVTAVARRAPMPPLRRKSRASGVDLATKLASAFDPESQRTRDRACAQRGLENTQVLTLSQQLRDANVLAENLRTRNTNLQNRVHALERENDRATLRAELMQLTQRDNEDRGRPRRLSRPRQRHRSHKNDPDIERVRGKIRCEHIYPDGGAMTYWVSDPSTDDYDYEYDENENPFEPSYDPPFVPIPTKHRSRSSSRHGRAVSRRRTPTPGPSRLRQHIPSSSPAHPEPTRTYVPSTTIAGNAVELVVTPRRGPPVAFIISPAAPKAGDDK
ncbi:hypothetical protein B0H16DRAFT_48467 [Mycena metata]|uniref:DUF6818 domain-containing protein n=1 Tax=Mycena metata TaxID=1033252 RepID=A0AAD7K2H8_9AGAR|nr:hypothetical protein B0H16DRAFT_48467 [Mycena metata]